MEKLVEPSSLSAILVLGLVYANGDLLLRRDAYARAGLF